jgi:hypothetical protein
MIRHHLRRKIIEHTKPIRDAVVIASLAFPSRYAAHVDLADIDVSC